MFVGRRGGGIWIWRRFGRIKCFVGETGRTVEAGKRVRARGEILKSFGFGCAVHHHERDRGWIGGGFWAWKRILSRIRTAANDRQRALYTPVWYLENQLDFGPRIRMGCAGLVNWRALFFLLCWSLRRYPRFFALLLPFESAKRGLIFFLALIEHGFVEDLPLLVMHGFKGQSLFGYISLDDFMHDAS